MGLYQLKYCQLRLKRAEPGQNEEDPLKFGDTAGWNSRAIQLGTCFILLQ